MVLLRATKTNRKEKNFLNTNNWKTKKLGVTRGIVFVLKIEPSYIKHKGQISVPEAVMIKRTNKLQNSCAQQLNCMVQ